MSFDWESAEPVESPKKDVTETRRVLEQAAEGPMQDIVSALPWAQAATGFAPLVGQPSGYGIDSSQALDAMRRVFGMSGQQPESVTGKAAGAGLRALTSPSNYAMGPLFGVPGMVSTGATSAGGAAGAELLGEYLGLPGYVIGGIAGGSPGLYANTGKTLFNTMQGVGETGDAVSSFVKSVGNRRASKVAQSIFESDSNAAANFLRAQEIEQLTKVKLPTSAASGGSNVVIQEMRSQGAQNLGFLDQIRLQEKAAEKAIFARAGKLFGAGSQERIIEATKDQASAVKSIDRRLKDVDASLSKAGSEIYSVDAVDLGNRITNLTKAKEELAVKQMSPIYESTLEAAEKAGIKLSADQTQTLYDFVTSSVNKDIFATFPGIYGKVLSKFKPEVLEDGTQVFKEASVRDLDSLKRGINKALRGDASADTRRILNNLKNELGTVVDELPAEFADAYRGADAEYLRKVGIPFSAKAIEDIGSKGFVEQTIPVLTQNPSGLQQFLDVAGNDAVPIVKDAFMYKLSNTANIVDEAGVINVRVLDKFLSDKNHKNTLKLVPELRDELNALKTDSQQLYAARGKLMDLKKQEQIREADTLFTKVSNQKLNTVLDNFLGIPTEQATIMKELNRNPEALKGFRASITDRVLQSGNPLEFYTANKTALDKLYGPSYTDNVKALAEAAQLLASNPVKLNVPISTIRKTKFEETVGMAPEQAVSLARRPIVSRFQQFTIGLSKFFQNNASKAERAAIQEFLGDSNKVAEAAKAYSQIEKTDNLSAVANVAKTFAGRTGLNLSYGAYLGLNEAVDSRQPAEGQQPEAVDMEFNF